MEGFEHIPLIEEELTDQELKELIKESSEDEYKEREVIEYYQRHKEDLTLRNKILCFAAETGAINIVDFMTKRKLLSSKALPFARRTDMEQENKEGKSPFYIATENNNVKVMELLCVRGARIDKRSSKVFVSSFTNRSMSLRDYGSTPLIAAIKAKHEEAVFFLCERGASVHETFEGKNVLQYAAEAGNPNIFETLEVLGAEVTAKCIGEKTPLVYAIEGGHREIVEYLERRGQREPLPSPSSSEEKQCS